LVIIAGIVAFVRNGLDGVSASLMQGAVVLMVALAGWWAIDHFARRDFLAERQALDARAFELTARAMAPGSALACLDAMAGDVVEDACEKALFASPRQPPLPFPMLPRSSRSWLPPATTPAAPALVRQ
jgi:hypothetical protein